MFNALKLDENPEVAKSVECNFDSLVYAHRNRRRMNVPYPGTDAFLMNFKIYTNHLWNSN